MFRFHRFASYKFGLATKNTKSHETVGKLVSQCEQAGCCLQDLTLEQLQKACELIQDDVYDVLGTANAMKALQSFGSGGLQPVTERLADWKSRLQSAD